MALPKPEAGLVISYGYLWRREHERGQVEGLKHRPCVIILAVERSDGETLVTVSPVTHSLPDAHTPAFELPPRVKAHLGLDAERSWVVLNEINQFNWPGFDILPLTGGGYGFLPPKLFGQIKDSIVAQAAAYNLKITKRD